MESSRTVSHQSTDNTAQLIGNSENNNTPWYDVPVLSFTGDIREADFDFYM